MPLPRPLQIALKAGGAACVCAVVLRPFWLWYRQPVRGMNVFIVDKTVPDNTRRGHAGLTWILQHRKYRRPGGGDFDRELDYYGFVPLFGHKWMAREPSIREARPEMIYLADTYGVTTEDFYHEPKGDQSPMVYGGLRMDEVQAVQDALPQCLTLIGEFNTFADPTAFKARQACEEMFGLSWNGWVGRFFTDLRRGKEMPGWAVRNWERQTGQPWAFEGPGFLLVNQDDRVEVLTEGPDVEPSQGLHFHGLPAGVSAFGMPSDARYDGWFDLVAPRPGTDVMAEYEFPVLPAGARKLQALGLSPRFPAVLTSHKGSTRIFYFAGNFADVWPPPNMHRLGVRDLPPAPRPENAR